MSNDTLPDVQTAYDNVFRGIHANAFFHKLAQLGHAPANEQEAQALLKLGFRLQSAEAAQPAQQKQAAQGFYGDALSALEGVLVEQGLIDPASVKTAADNEAEAAAAQLAQDPTLFASALVLTRAQG